MIRITKIVKIEPFSIVCVLNNGAMCKLDVEPLIEKHRHLNGVEKLLDFNKFQEVQIGEMGEIKWEGIVKFSDSKTGTSVWD
jgi:hypothetical protein